MSEILIALSGLVFLAFVVILSMLTLGKDTNTNKGSKCIVNRIVPDNDAPKLTDMIEYHKNSEKIHYTINE